MGCSLWAHSGPGGCESPIVLPSPGRYKTSRAFQFSFIPLLSVPISFWSPGPGKDAEVTAVNTVYPQPHQGPQKGFFFFFYPNPISWTWGALLWWSSQLWSHFAAGLAPSHPQYLWGWSVSHSGVAPSVLLILKTPQHHLPPSTWDPQGLNLHLINHSSIPSWHIYKFKFETHWYDFRRTSSSLWVLLSSSAKWEVDRRTPKLPSIWGVLCLFQGALCFKSFEQKTSLHQQYTQDWAVFTPSAELECLTLNVISL